MWERFRWYMKKTMKPIMEKTPTTTPIPIPVLAPVLRPRLPAVFPGVSEAVGSVTSLVNGTALPETIVAPLKAGACVELEKSGVAETLPGFRTLY